MTDQENPQSDAPQREGPALPALLPPAERNLLSVVGVYGGTVRFVPAGAGRWRLDNADDTFDIDTFRSLGRHGLVFGYPDPTVITPAGQHWLDMFPNVVATSARRDLLLSVRAGQVTATRRPGGRIDSVQQHDRARPAAAGVEVYRQVIVLAAVLLVEMPGGSGPVTITPRGEWAIDLWRTVGGDAG